MSYVYCSVDKHLANGDFDKCKSWIVLHGNGQDPHHYPDKSSLTVAVYSILTYLVVPVLNRMTEVAKIDVKGAFMQTPMKGPTIHIRFNPDLTQLIVKMYPQYANAKGCLYGKLLKARYGCIQASKLWFNNLVRFLKKQGYEQCPTDPCVMRKIKGQMIFLLLIYIDSILVLATHEEME